LAVVRWPFPAAPVFVHRKNLAVIPRLLPAAALVVHRRAVFIHRDAQAVAHGGALFVEGN
jgi:hypothetical protein